jgi:hypothetical protein
MEQEIRKITNLGIFVPLLQHIQDLVFLTILQYHDANEIVVQILQHRMVKDNDLIQSANI